MEDQVSQKSVNYRPGSPDASCSSCMHFRPPDACELVSGKIKPDGLCDLYEQGQGVQQLRNPAVMA